MKNIISLLCLLLWMCGRTYAQQVVMIDSTVDEHIFTYGEIDYLEDPTGKLSLDQARSAPYDTLFRASNRSTPQNENLRSTYWYRVRVRHNSRVQKHYILEFFDQTIDNITAWMPDSIGNYHAVQTGDDFIFSRRLFAHKNFELPLDNNHNKESVYYFRVYSRQTADVIIVLRSVNRFVGYALSEYFSFGLFYGMILIFSFYNLIMFIAMRQRQYLYYVLYNLSVALYEMCTDGIAYQYLWPHSPTWNQYAYAVPLCGMSIFALLFTRKLLNVKVRAPLLNKLVVGIIIARIAWFVVCALIDPFLFTYKFIEVIPLAVAFYTGIYTWSRGYRPARFFVLGYSFLFIGFMLKFFIMLGYEWLNFGIISYYSLSFCFIFEMFFLSFAVGDKVRLMKRQKDKVHRQMMRQMMENARLKDTLNKELETLVQQRTRELSEQSVLVASRNEELLQANELLQQQAREISRMNALLEQDNKQLTTNVEKVSRARALSAPVDFEEFSRTYPDKESCFQFLADLKWSEGYCCRKCSNEQYFNGHQPLSRRCTKCGYEESVTANTIFQNSHIPITKAFYMTYLVYSSKGKISSHKLSDMVDIRQSTCWSYASRITKMMAERQKELKQGNGGWSRLVLIKD